MAVFHSVYESNVDLSAWWYVGEGDWQGHAEEEFAVVRGEELWDVFGCDGGVEQAVFGLFVF